jgi:DNA-binding transcriptional regulator/RsmH inhibitor MraZ
MGKACRNVAERASKGSLNCPVEFENQFDLQYAGVLVTLPALIACGILNGISRFDLSKVYYNTTQIFLSLAFMVMLRVKQVEQSRLLSCGELGRCLGMDRTPCTQTIRNRLNDYTATADVGQWSLELSRHWMKQDDIEGVLYVDGHVNIYYGKSIEMPERYVSRMRLCLSGSTDYWVNGAIGQPYFVVHKTVNEGMIKAITTDIIPELDKSVPHQPTAKELTENPLLHRYMIVFDREGYSVPFFIELKKSRIAFCTYRKNVKDTWGISEFKDYTVKDKSGATVCMKLAERGTYLTTQKVKGKPVEGIWVREVRKLNPSGHQTAIITTNFTLSITDIGVYMFARWNQEIYFKYQSESFGIDCLISNMKNSIPDTYTIPNPDYIAIDQQHKSIAGKLSKQKQKLAEKMMDIERHETEERQMTKYLRQKSEILLSVESYQRELETIKSRKKDIPKRIDVRDADPEKELLTAINDQKQLMDTIKMIGYRAETALANKIKPLMSSPEQARNLIRSIYQANADLKVDKKNNRLCLLLHHSNFAAVDNIIRVLFDDLNKSETKFPGSNLTLFYILVSDKFHQ